MTSRRRRWVLLVACVSAMVVALDNLILNVALPTLVRELHASTSELQWIVDTYLLVFAGLLLVGGSLGDRFGRAKMLRVGLMVFGTASFTAAFSASATALAVCRGVMGVGAALILPASVAILTNVYTDPRERGRALGVWASIGGLGLALGPVLGGVLLSQFWWGSIFLVNVPIALIALLVGWWAMPESRNPETSRFDPLGVVLSVLGVSTLVWAAIQAPTRGWGSIATLGSFVVAFATLGCFVLWELHCAHPMLELRFFCNSRFSVANLTCGLSNIAWAGILFVLTQLLQSVFGYSPLTAGLGLVPMSAAFMVAGAIGPRLAERFGTQWAVALGLGVFAAGLVVLTTTTQHSGYLWTLPATLGIGAGIGFTNAPLADAVMGSVPRQQAGLASGTYSTTKQTCNALGVAVVGSLLVSGYHSTLATRTRGLGLSHADVTAARASLSAALGVAHRLGGETGRVLGDAARSGFIHGMHLGAILGIALLALGVVLVLRYLPARAPDVSVSDAHDADDVRGYVPLDVIID
jgi:EmrB/QacA subfamily drug resistance transporter